MPAPVESKEIALLTRSAPVQNYNADQRTFEIVWTTGAKVRRYDWQRERWFDESLSLSPPHVRMGRLSSGKAKLLDSHRTFGLSSILGVVERAQLNGAEGTGTIRFSKRQAAREVEDDVRDGIITDISVGYRVRKFEMVPPTKDGDVWEYRAVDWEPYEVSLVAIGADDGAGVRSADDDIYKGARMAPCEFINAGDSSSENQEKDMLRSFIAPLGIKVDEGADEAAVRSAVVSHLGLKADASTDEIVAAALKRSEPAPAPVAASAPDDLARTKVETQADERKRAADLIQFCATHRATPDLQAKAISEGWSVERTGLEILNLRAATGDAVPTNTAIPGGESRKRSVWDELKPNKE